MTRVCSILHVWSSVWWDSTLLDVNAIDDLVIAYFGECGCFGGEGAHELQMRFSSLSNFCVGYIKMSS